MQRAGLIAVLGAVLSASALADDEKILAELEQRFEAERDSRVRQDLGPVSITSRLRAHSGNGR